MWALLLPSPKMENCNTEQAELRWCVTTEEMALQELGSAQPVHDQQWPSQLMLLE